MEITKRQFKAYENVRLSNKTNMFMISNVMALSGLEKEQILEIMENYEKLEKDFK